MTVDNKVLQAIYLYNEKTIGKIAIE